MPSASFWAMASSVICAYCCGIVYRELSKVLKIANELREQRTLMDKLLSEREHDRDGMA